MIIRIVSKRTMITAIISKRTMITAIITMALISKSTNKSIEEY